MSLSPAAQAQYNEMNSWIHQNKLNSSDENIEALAKSLKHYCKYHIDEVELPNPKPVEAPSLQEALPLPSRKKRVKAQSLNARLEAFTRYWDEANTAVESAAPAAVVAEQGGKGVSWSKISQMNQ